MINIKKPVEKQLFGSRKPDGEKAFSVVNKRLMMQKVYYKNVLRLLPNFLTQCC